MIGALAIVDPRQRTIVQEVYGAIVGVCARGFSETWHFAKCELMSATSGIPPVAANLLGIGIHLLVTTTASDDNSGDSGVMPSSPVKTERGPSEIIVNGTKDVFIMATKKNNSLEINNCDGGTVLTGGRNNRATIRSSSNVQAEDCGVSTSIKVDEAHDVQFNLDGRDTKFVASECRKIGIEVSGQSISAESQRNKQGWFDVRNSASGSIVHTAAADFVSRNEAYDVTESINHCLLFFNVTTSKSTHATGGKAVRILRDESAIKAVKDKLPTVYYDDWYRTLQPILDRRSYEE